VSSSVSEGRAPVLSRHALRSLARALARWPAARGRGLEPALRERIILHVSSVNSCPVCSAVHGHSARRLGLDQGEVMAARMPALDGWDPRTRAVLRYAELRTMDHERAHPAEVAAFERLFTPAEQESVRATIDLFTFTNRFNNTWERWLPGAAARRRRMGLG
jgi:AhpD family alkylhydroperoxidase